MPPHIFFSKSILYRSYKISPGQSLLELYHNDLANAKQELESFANSFNIMGKFYVKLKLISKPLTI